MLGIDLHLEDTTFVTQRKFLLDFVQNQRDHIGIRTEIEADAKLQMFEARKHHHSLVEELVHFRPTEVKIGI